ncbi:MAG: hypothetical protein L3J03_08240 [Desulfobacterales bacterium]|nr:hypothetical protein [Desulfobacterales bacterium]
MSRGFEAKKRDRRKQLDLSKGVLDVIERFGQFARAEDGGARLTLSKRDAGKVIRSLKKTIRQLDRAAGVVVIERDGALIRILRR